MEDSGMEESKNAASETWKKIFAALDKAVVPDDFLTDRLDEPPQERDWDSMLSIGVSGKNNE
jgi:hypothetical protein